MAITRVYILAKELGVESTAIIKKCQAEDINITNHMATISAGLAATIREWFSEGENVTTVETANKVDLEKVRAKRKPRKKPTQEVTPAEETAVAQAAAIEAPPEPEVVEEKPAEVESVPQPQAPAPAPVAETIAPPAPQRVTILPPKEPEVIVPAGPMLEKPQPAILSGPQVVRVEAPEPLRKPKPRHVPKTKYNAPATEPLIAKEHELKTGGTAASKDKKRPAKKQKQKTPDREGDWDSEAVKRSKFDTLRRQRDIEERRARISAAGGESFRLRPTRKISSKSHAAGPAAIARPEKATISEPIIVKDLSAALAVKSSDIIEKLIQQGVMATSNQTIAPNVAELIALEFGTELTVVKKTSLEDQIKAEFEAMPRPNPTKRTVIATMLGHVDHGKTSLLDKIRSTRVTDTEAGGITQHIGAYQAAHGDTKVTFLDTPGHEAFTAMRARGANMTDVVVLVVAADDGVMPQTIEAINHAKAAQVPVIVALNKIDLPSIDINRIYAQLSEHGLTPTEWSGDTEIVKTSAITGKGIDDLLEHLDYVTELLELKADNTIPATGWVVEAKMSAQRGVVATLLIKEGCLNKGDIILAGCAYGRIKAIKNSFGKTIKTATSSMPVEVIGLSDVPQAGDRFYRLDDINKAKAAAEENQVRSRESTLTHRTQVTLDNLFSQIAAGDVKELNIIIRADVQGSVDVLTKYLSELSTEEVKVKILHASPGGITEGDVLLAEASNAIIIGFNVVAEEHVKKIAESAGVEIRNYSIIYRITEDLRKSMAGLLEPEEKEESIGKAVVRNTFKVSKVGTIAGCYVSDGVAKKKAKVRLIRNNVVVRDNLAIESLKHFKDDASEIKAGLECGIKVEKFDDVKVDDILEFYEIVKIARTL